MHNFLTEYREELILRCKEKVSRRPYRAATDAQLANGVPMFLDQLTRTLAAERNDDSDDSIKISGRAGGDSAALSEIGISATAHGKELLDLGYSLDQVVHDYGDLCQAITDLAFECNQPFSVDEFRTLNRCLDNAMADSVTGFSAQRDADIARDTLANETQRLGCFAHELRNALETATNAVRALEMSNMPVAGAIGAVLKRSLSALGKLIDQSVAVVRQERPAQRQTFALVSFIAEAAVAVRLNTNLRGCTLEVSDVDPLLEINANRETLHAALANLLQNAFKFTTPNSVVSLNAHALEKNFAYIDISDHCGGLAPGDIVHMFAPFTQHDKDRSGLGLGLTIARKNIENDFGTLTVRNVPGTGCVFTIRLPLVERH
jgi:signal transduction histidine kinase